MFVSHSGLRRVFLELLVIGVLFVSDTSSARVSADELAKKLSIDLDSQRILASTYQIQIQGSVIVPGDNGDQKLSLTSQGDFEFKQRQFANTGPEPSSVQAVRKFSLANTTTKVGPDHTTRVNLSREFSTIHAFGMGNRLVFLSPEYLIPRKQLDLLQLPFDPLVTGSILPGSSVKVGDKWNTDYWIVPILTGIEVVVDQSATCTLKSLTDETAVITLVGKISGATVGSATNVSFSGEIQLDRKLGFIKSFLGQQKEKRIPGPVSPGLDVTANIRWTQAVDPDGTSLATTMDSKIPDEQKLTLVLQTPLKLQLKHSREWHMFHETPTVLMMRQLRDGHLVAQCNLSTAVSVPPNDHTPDREFLSDVTTTVMDRKGKVLSEDTIRDDEKWRIRQVRAIGDAAGDVIRWDYYLCTAKSGEQFSFVFSYSQADEKLFGDEAMRILNSLQVARPRTAFPFR